MFIECYAEKVGFKGGEKLKAVITLAVCNSVVLELQTAEVFYLIIYLREDTVLTKKKMIFTKQYALHSKSMYFIRKLPR